MFAACAAGDEPAPLATVPRAERVDAGGGIAITKDVGGAWDVNCRSEAVAAEAGLAAPVTAAVDAGEAPRGPRMADEAGRNPDASDPLFARLDAADPAFGRQARLIIRLDPGDGVWAGKGLRIE